MIREHLNKAEQTTLALFDAVEKNGLITPGKTESQLVAEICALAAGQFGIDQYWHKKIVRTGKNTCCAYPENPPDTPIQEGDIVILDFGPIVNGYEADLGRTYVPDGNPALLKMKNDVQKAWYEIQHWYNGQTALTSAAMFRQVVDTAAAYGYEFGGEIAGHIVGKYPHEQPADPKSLELDIHPHNHHDILVPDAGGNKRHWILELLFIDRAAERGVYFEQLL